MSRGALTIGMLLSQVSLAADSGPKAADYRSLFHGGVRGDARGNVVLSYDFSRPEQFEDFADAGASDAKELNAGSRERTVWLKPHFDGDLIVEMRIRARGGACFFPFLFDPAAGEGYIIELGVSDIELSGRSYNYITKYGKGTPQTIYRGLLGPWKPRTCAVALARRKDRFEIRLDGRVVGSQRDPDFTSGQIGFGGDFAVLSLTVKGTLNARWCEKALTDADASASEGAIRIGPPVGLMLSADIPRWKQPCEKETEHYIVLSDVDQKFTDLHARYAEAMYAMFAGVFPSTKKPEAKLRIVIFKTREEFQAFGAPADILGFYLPSNRILYLYDHVKPALTLEVLIHEGFHQYIHLLLDEIPVWFNEGMAQFFETAEFVRNGFKIGASSRRAGHLAYLVRTQRDRFPREFLRIGEAEFRMPNRMLENYAQAWGMCHFLILFKDGKYRGALNRYYEALLRGEGADAAYRAAFSAIDWETLLQEWRAYVPALSGK
ncbi:MAG: DUF1570 domain-containing protein [Planctomycetes bacterium]|nr:DUF1570 domain-containing protein [Planctomycetota bacterium]